MRKETASPEIKFSIFKVIDNSNRYDNIYSAKSQDFFDDNATIGRRYTITRIKSRNFLTNIAYVGINKEDY